MKQEITLNVNEETYDLVVENRKTLLEVLRNDLHLLGTRQICGRGECGACTVIMDGLAVNSCLILAADAHGKRVETIEGLAKGDVLHPVQEAFISKGAIQCGYCTSGMVMTAKAFLEKHPHPQELEVRKAIEGNFCRCTGYARIVEAIMSTSLELKE
jgi:carbon-monoxide dehydrogenase small subunit